MLKRSSFSVYYIWIVAIETTGQVQGNPGPGGQAEHGRSLGDGQEKRSLCGNQRYVRMIIPVLQYRHPSLFTVVIYGGFHSFTEKITIFMVYPSQFDVFIKNLLFLAYNSQFWYILHCNF